MAESIYRYSRVIQSPGLGSFFFQSFTCSLFLPILVILLMLSIVKGRGVVREHVTSTYLTSDHIYADVLHAIAPTGNYLTIIQDEFSRE